MEPVSCRPGGRPEHFRSVGALHLGRAKAMPHTTPCASCTRVLFLYSVFPLAPRRRSIISASLNPSDKQSCPNWRRDDSRLPLSKHLLWYPQKSANSGIVSCLRILTSCIMSCAIILLPFHVHAVFFFEEQKRVYLTGEIKRHCSA